MIEFSVANKINIFIETESMSVSCKKFLSLIYNEFPAPVEFSKKTLRVRVGDVCFSKNNLVKLGGDAFYNDGILYLTSGHAFVKNSETIEIVIPRKVKRGRIPFKRITPGRHVSDEIIEPLLVALLQGMGVDCYHASSIVDTNGVATVNIAWRGTGKTDAILPYIFDGCVLSDDLSFIDEAESILYAYPRPLRLYKYNIHRLNVSKLDKFLLHLKSKITPPWKPVKYIPLKPSQLAVNKYKKTYLNENFSKVTPDVKLDREELFSNITDFEFAYFSATKAMLRMAKII